MEEPRGGRGGRRPLKPTAPYSSSRVSRTSRAVSWRAIPVRKEVDLRVGGTKEPWGGVRGEGAPALILGCIPSAQKKDVNLAAPSPRVPSIHRPQRAAQRAAEVMAIEVLRNNTFS
jgi:hypothetical protein